jgi:eukaryotic-like serine/threonine-protein kinase
MELWSDYEGKTIAEAYPLGQLIRPEGRSAFFATSNGTGTAAVIRLTESLNDENEMLERWRRVSELKQEHLVTIRKFGQTRYENTPLAYALMEPTDGSLAEILRDRPLTPAEAREVAVSLVEALAALHANGLVHGQVETANVLAVGEVVKLRSDCVRECVVDAEFLTVQEFEELLQRDVEGVARVLLEALTLKTTLTGGTMLPTPFDGIVRRGLDGSWGLKEMGDALNPPAVVERPVKPLVPESVLTASQGFERPRVVLEPKPRPELKMRAVHWQQEVEPERGSYGWKLGLGFALTAVLVLLWLFLPAGRAPVTAAPATAFAPIDDAPVGKPPAAAAGSASAGVASSGIASAATQAGWHVVAYTYHREEQAFQRVEAIKERHPELNAEVFAPNGRAPYLVGLGGAMSEEEAGAMKGLARKEGMPHDTFARRYGDSTR